MRWHKLGEVENECTWHNFVALTIFVPKLVEVVLKLTKLWLKQFRSFMRHGVRCTVVMLVCTQTVWTWTRTRNVRGRQKTRSASLTHDTCSHTVAVLVHDVNSDNRQVWATFNKFPDYVRNTTTVNCSILTVMLLFNIFSLQFTAVFPLFYKSAGIRSIKFFYWHL